MVRAAVTPQHLADVLAMRWGPGLADLTPGIVIQKPDLTRSRAALRAASPRETYAAEERRAIREADDETGFIKLGLIEVSPCVWVDPEFINFDFGT